MSKVKAVGNTTKRSGHKKVHVVIILDCAKCDGIGEKETAPEYFNDCTKCKGTGKLTFSSQKAADKAVADGNALVGTYEEREEKAREEYWNSRLPLM